MENNKQETLEEAAEYKSHHSEEDFIRGGRWQQERMYSKEEVDKMFETLKLYSVKNVATITNVDLFISSWKREFKKK